MTSGQRPRERDEKGGRDNGGDCTKESRCNPAARVVARETDRERGGGCATPGTRAVDSTPRDGTNDISTRFRFLQSRIIVRRVFGKFIERRMNNGCFFGLVVVLLLLLLLLFCFVHLLVQTEKGLGWENDSRREILL